MSRLPQPGSDKGTWGDILNDFLVQSHNTDGSIKADVITSVAIAPNAITSVELAPNAVTAANIATGAITPTQLSSNVQASLANADAAVTGTAPDSSTTTKGLVKLAGSLSGTAALPTIAAGVITDANISSSAAISQSKVSGLTAAIAAKADASTLSTVATTGSYTDLANKPTIPTVPVTSVAGRTGVITLTSTDVGLANVNNTADTAKPISTATQTALNLKANTSSLSTVATTGLYSDLTSKPTLSTVATSGAYTDLTGKPALAAIATTGSYNDLLDVPVGSGTVSSVSGRTGAITLTSADVGLGNVNNTGDANKPVSTATQTALNLKANSSSLATVATTGSYNDLTNLPSGGGAVSSVAGRTGAVTLTSSDVGLANVNNTADTAKPVSTAQQTALNAKLNISDRPAMAFVVVWSGSAWQYQGATITARPSGLVTGDIIMFVGNPGGSLPSWAATNDIWTQG